MNAPTLFPTVKSCLKKGFVASLTSRGLSTSHPSGPSIPDLPPSITAQEGELYTFNPLNLNDYTISTPPNAVEAKGADRFCTSQPPTLLFSAAAFHSLPAESNHPEVAFLGRSNVGKSSLLNALFHRNNIAYTSRKPGKTRLMNAFGVSPHPVSAPPKQGSKGDILAQAWRRFRGGMVVVDMPGYGAASRSDWGAMIMKYLEQRQQLRRTFVLVDSEHGLKKTDIALLTHLYRRGLSHSIVLSKADKLLYPNAKPPEPMQLHKGFVKLKTQIGKIKQQLQEEVWGGRMASVDFLSVSGEKTLDTSGRGRKIGIDELRWAALCACGLERETQSGKPRIDRFE